MTSAGDPQVPGVSNLRPIGRGGFSTVYRGERGGTAVAVKILDATVADKIVKRRFDKECDVLQRAGKLSPYVVRLYDHGILADQRPYLILEYCAGGEPRLRQMTAEEIIEVGLSVAQALRSLHGAGILHRDIKPGNILFTSDDADAEIRLSDFGLALQPDPALSRGYDAMVPEYAAREIIRGGRPTTEADVYSLGATLYALRMGGSPYPQHTGENDLQYAARVLPLPDVNMTAFGDPPALRDLVARMIATDPAQRPTAAEAVAALSTMVGRTRFGDERSTAGVPVAGHPDATRLRARSADLAGTAGRTGAPDRAGRTSTSGTRLRARDRVALDLSPAGTEGSAPFFGREKSKGRKVAIGAGAAAVAVAVTFGVLAMVHGGEDGDAASSGPPAAASGASLAAAAPSGSLNATIVLEPAKDNGATVDLTWSGPADLEYGVVVAHGSQSSVTLAQHNRSASIPVGAGEQYCFQIQATNGLGVVESNVVGVRGAVCRFS